MVDINNILRQPTPASPPTSVSLSATLAERSVILSWSGAAPGTGGPISGFPIEYSDSPDGSTWGAWIDLYYYSTREGSGSYSVDPPSIRGYCRRFRVRTVPTTGEDYASPWVISSNSVRRNTLPTAPSTFTVSPSTYQSGESVTLTWSGAAAGTSAIKNYVIQYATSANNSTWSGYSTLATVTTSATSGSYSYTPGTAARFLRYRICVTDTLDCISSYVTSNIVQRNTPPTTPAISAPKNGATTYNTRPRFLITTGVDVDGDRQMLCEKTAEGMWHDSVNNPDYFSPSGWLGDNTAVIYRHDPLETGHYGISVKAKDEDVLEESGEATRSFTVAPSPFDEIIPNETPVRAAHITAPRTAINNVRAYYGLAPFAWRKDIVPGRTRIEGWTFHIMELRTAVDQVVDTINKYETAPEFRVLPIEWIPLRPGRPSAEVMEQLHINILNL